jgi:DNA-3-methyladenine glycosylase II
MYTLSTSDRDGAAWTRPARTGAQGQIACRPPFDLQRSLDFLCGFGPTQGEQSLGPGSLTKALMVGGRAVGVRVEQPEGDAPSLRYELAADGPIDAATRQAVAARVAFFLSADEDLGAFYEIVGRDAALASALPRLRGLHHVKFPTPFEAACWGVINQRIGMTGARAMKTALTRRLGAPVAIDGRTHWAFPEARAVATLGEPALAELLGSERKARSVHAVSRAFAAVSEAFLREAPHGDVKAWLEGIHGVGEFTTGFVMFRGLGRFERAPMSPRFLRAVREVYGAISEPEVRALVERYGAWAGHWALYVYASTFPCAR